MEEVVSFEVFLDHLKTAHEWAIVPVPDGLLLHVRNSKDDMPKTYKSPHPLDFTYIEYSLFISQVACMMQFRGGDSAV